MTRRIATPLALLASFAVAGYAGVRLLAGNPSGTTTWFIGSALVHDLLLFPLYTGLDTTLVTLLRHRPALATVAGVPWLNHLRIPTVISGLLLLVWFPLVLRVPAAASGLTAASGLSPQPFLPHWLTITTVLFTASATVLATRTGAALLRQRNRNTSPKTSPKRSLRGSAAR